MGKRYNRRVIAYSVAAVMLPIVGVVAQRIATTPDAMPQWHSQTMAAHTATLGRNLNGGPAYYEGIMPDAFYSSGFANKFARATNEMRLEMLQQELDGEVIGEHVSLDDLQLVSDYAGEFELR